MSELVLRIYLSFSSPANAVGATELEHYKLLKYNWVGFFSRS